MIMIIINEVGILRGIMNKKKIQTKMQIQWPIQNHLYSNDR